VNIQIFGRNKCFDTKKAQRWFKERRVKFQYIDIDRFGMSRGELSSVKNAVGLAALIEEKDQDYPLLQYLATDDARFEKLLEDPYLIKTPVVRNGKQAAVGYQPDIWKTWE
jgi:arsenate reductase